MDYEKKYKEALKLAKSYHDDPNCFKHMEGTLEHIFPELAESEDEKIRKEIINYFKCQSRDEPTRKDIHNKWIAWLEKQGEQKPDTQHSTEWSVSDFRTWQYIVSDVLTKKDGIGQYLDSGECKNIAKYMQEEWGKKLSIEQKSADLPKGEDYGIDGLYHAIRILEETLGKIDGYQTDDGILEHKCAISAVKNLYEQKPAWSEEDDTFFKAIIRDIENTKYISEDAKKDRISWLKSLKDRVQPQPKQEWSEEDEAMFRSILTDVKIAWKNTLNAFEDDIEQYQEQERCMNEVLSFLKSLHPQKQWKPSEEQMEALKEACMEHYDPKGALYSLCEDLVAL